MDLDLVKIWELAKMVGLAMLTVAVFLGVIICACKGEFADKVTLPWEKAERKAEKRRQKELAKNRKREMKRYAYGK